MEWTDTATILSVRRFGETGALVEVLAQTQGRFAGLVHGGASRTKRPLLQPGNRIQAHWRARLADHLGTLSVEADHLRAGTIMDDPLALSAMSCACELARLCLPEREPHGPSFEGLDVLLDTLDDPDIWPALFVRYEAGLLDDVGYGLDLSRCAVSGVRDTLSHVSPKSGRAVCEAEAAPYIDKLLPLPAFLLGAQARVTANDVENGLRLTGYFLERRILWPADRQLPEARARMLKGLERYWTKDA